ncbi:rapamycin-insensitive companion of mTOR [Elysia marginata]|uniref:Rapamycin-insensitive companion of mTOR n=1 Tax=Elysia marginata TaxID=1093978 RepID=A0AAV4J052_9GAST|nr:rapamycin-insensitive companion of mTOR [Elysia marginata]
MRRNVSNISLQDQDAPSSPLSTLNRAAFKPLSPSNRFVGITLPVDIRMIFEVLEGEDQRSSSVPVGSLTNQSAIPKPEGVSLSSHVPPLKLDTSFTHNTEICLLCTGFRQRNMPSTGEKNETEGKQGQTNSETSEDTSGQSAAPSEEASRLRGGSVAETVNNTPGSNTSSSGSQDTGPKKLTEDSESGRELIRMEVMRLIVNLGSSVGLKASETGLLNLKQRFPKCFRDICFYSEVCHLLSTYSYRLLARRFIHELFDDVNIEQLLACPCQYLDIDTFQHMEPIQQDSLDEFHDFSFS